MAQEPSYFDVPIPDALSTIVAIHDGNRWLQGVIPGTVKVERGVLTCLVNWNHGQSKRRYSLAVDLIGGYQTDDAS